MIIRSRYLTVYKLMQVKNLFLFRQLGFRSNISTSVHALTNITEPIQSNNHLDVSCIILDLRKTFDTINHGNFFFQIGELWRDRLLFRMVNVSGLISKIV